MPRLFHPDRKRKQLEASLCLRFRLGLIGVVLAALGAEPPRNPELLPKPIEEPMLGSESPRKRELSPSFAAPPLAESAKNRELPPAPVVAPALAAAPTAPAPPPPPLVLRSGEAVTLRILQVVPIDGFSRGERLLNGRNPIVPGDRFLAEVLEPHCEGPALLGGCVTKVVRPGWFGHPGYVTLQLLQFIPTADGKSEEAPWQMNTQDRRLAERIRRLLLDALITTEWTAVGLSAGAQDLALHNGMWVGGAAAVGSLIGLGFASLQRGTEATLEPGDTFRIVVGTMKYRPVPKDWQTILYPAADPAKRKPRR